jgi:hypothetical protein
MQLVLIDDGSFEKEGIVHLRPEDWAGMDGMVD